MWLIYLLNREKALELIKLPKLYSLALQTRLGRGAGAEPLRGILASTPPYQLGLRKAIKVFGHKYLSVLILELGKNEH